MNGSTPTPNQTLPATSTNPNTNGSQGSKSSTPLTEIPTPKSVIQQNQNQTTVPPSAATPEPTDDVTDDVNGQNDVTPASERNSVVRTTVDDAAAAVVTAAVAAQVTAGVGVLQKDMNDIRRPTKSVISDSLLSDNGTETTTPVPQANGQEDGQVSNEAQSVLNNFTNNHAILNQRFVQNTTVFIVGVISVNISDDIFKKIANLRKFPSKNVHKINRFLVMGEMKMT